MTHNYTPRRCSKRWLDGDCPRDVLAIIDHGYSELERYDVFYADVETVNYSDSSYKERWLTYITIGEQGQYSHGEMKAHEVAAYRYRMKHKYARWSDLPDAVKNTVRRDIAEAKKWQEANA